MELKGLFQLGRVEKEVVLSPEVKVKLHTLSVAEQQKAFVEVPTEATVVSDAARFAFLQQTILTYAIDSINGEKVSLEQIKEILAGLQYSILSTLFAEYAALASEQEKTLEELKKK